MTVLPRCSFIDITTCRLVDLCIETPWIGTCGRKQCGRSRRLLAELFEAVLCKMSSRLTSMRRMVITMQWAVHYACTLFKT